MLSCDLVWSLNIEPWDSLYTIMWRSQLLMKVGLKTSVPTKLLCDNQVAMHRISNPIFHEQTKHIEIDCHFVCEKIQSGLISTRYVRIEK